MLWLKRLLIVIFGIPTAVVIVFLITADYGVIGSVHYINRPPFASVSWGPAERYIVQHGVNAVGDNPMHEPGNFLEFPMSGDTRVSIRLLSGRWYRLAFAGWASDHRWAARWLGLRPSGQGCEAGPGSGPGCQERPAQSGSS